MFLNLYEFKNWLFDPNFFIYLEELIYMKLKKNIKNFI